MSFCSKINIVDWLKIYEQPAGPWPGLKEVRIEKLELKHLEGEDPVKYRIQASTDKFKNCGYGESNYYIHALEMALSELFEREVGLRSGAKSSNGIAAHRFLMIAKRWAMLELVERDAFFRHWLTKTPMIDVTNRYLKVVQELAYKIRNREHTLRVFETFLGAEKSHIAVIKDRASKGFVIGSSCKDVSSRAVVKATREAFYSLFAFDYGKTNWEVGTLANHRMYWYKEREIPEWLDHPIRKKPKSNRPKFEVKYEVLSTKPVAVVSATSSGLIDLWAGKDVSQSAIQIIKNSFGCKVNLDPHPFP